MRRLRQFLLFALFGAAILANLMLIAWIGYCAIRVAIWLAWKFV